MAVSGQAVGGTYCFQYSGTINTISGTFTPSIANGNAPFNSGLIASSGSFATNGSGVLTSVMTNWQDTSVGTDFTLI